MDTPGNNRKIRHSLRVDRQILARARRQYGHVTRSQLLALGLRSATIDGRLESGRLVAVHAGVYAVGAPRDEPVARAAAAVLSCGPGAVLSHSSAATLWGMKARWEPPFEVTHTVVRVRSGIRTHRCRTLRHRDIRRHLGIRVTSPARTLLDIAPAISTRALARAVNDARRSGHVHVETLADLLRHCPNHPGAKLLAPYVERPAGPTRSEFEDAFLAFAAEHRLPEPLVNTTLNGGEVDALFPHQMVIVELDGWDFHNDRTAFETDRERDASALAAGYATVRITWERLNSAPSREAARLRQILDDRAT
jgi:very-short-patch-repair endonuclease